MKSPITTHILDTSLGQPASGISVTLYRIEDGAAKQVGDGVTDDDGRIMQGLIEVTEYVSGPYQLRFAVASYFADQKLESFYPKVTIDFTVDAEQQHYHVPLLLSPFGYSTYRGS